MGRRSKIWKKNQKIKKGIEDGGEKLQGRIETLIDQQEQFNNTMNDRIKALQTLTGAMKNGELLEEQFDEIYKHLGENPTSGRAELSGSSRKVSSSKPPRPPSPEAKDKSYRRHKRVQKIDKFVRDMKNGKNRTVMGEDSSERSSMGLSSGRDGGYKGDYDDIKSDHQNDDDSSANSSLAKTYDELGLTFLIAKKKNNKRKKKKGGSSKNADLIDKDILQTLQKDVSKHEKKAAELNNTSSTRGDMSTLRAGSNRKSKTQSPPPGTVVLSGSSKRNPAVIGDDGVREAAEAGTTVTRRVDGFVPSVMRIIDPTYEDEFEVVTEEPQANQKSSTIVSSILSVIDPTYEEEDIEIVRNPTVKETTSPAPPTENTNPSPAPRTVNNNTATNVASTLNAQPGAVLCDESNNTRGSPNNTKGSPMDNFYDNLALTWTKSEISTAGPPKITSSRSWGDSVMRVIDPTYEEEQEEESREDNSARKPVQQPVEQPKVQTLSPSEQARQANDKLMRKTHQGVDAFSSFLSVIDPLYDGK